MEKGREVVIIRGLAKNFPMGTGRFTALKNIDLTLERGEFSGLVGPSGSGKTTLLNVIGSLDAPSEGEVRVLGNAVNGLKHAQAATLRARHLGFIFQTHNLLPVYNVFENVELPLLLLNMPRRNRREAVLRAIESVGLTDRLDSRPTQLSGGECQRVAIARAMVKIPELVLADEPTANLDAENSHHILRTMLTLNEKLGTTFLFASHDEKVIGYLRRIIRLVDGRIAEDHTIANPRLGRGTPAERGAP